MCSVLYTAQHCSFIINICIINFSGNNLIYYIIYNISSNINKYKILQVKYTDTIYSVYFAEYYLDIKLYTHLNFLVCPYSSLDNLER